ncbi:SH3 domain-containing protein [Variovorax sp. Sphag1AA]|uniref:SH3 domain-containing protein n=1 Tax=Variovorax sp. Sphag1AA TaxID=2587027 RepID=UPI0017F946A6|nr:SH3 domain-containing protein [Variovorax sp. Sphag1AA]MBB3180218.1 uncharacterized protein YraI [Variovorax sp. Sphag1AA]
MQKQTWRWIGTCAIALSLPMAAAAQQAFTRGSVNLRAGPSSSYPLVATLMPGQPLQVMGCTAGFAWCDVVLPDGLRGWAYAAASTTRTKSSTCRWPRMARSSACRS